MEEVTSVSFYFERPAAPSSAFGWNVRLRRARNTFSAPRSEIDDPSCFKTPDKSRFNRRFFFVPRGALIRRDCGGAVITVTVTALRQHSRHVAAAYTSYTTAAPAVTWPVWRRQTECEGIEGLFCRYRARCLWVAVGTGVCLCFSSAPFCCHRHSVGDLFERRCYVTGTSGHDVPPPTSLADAHAQPPSARACLVT